MPRNCFAYKKVLKRKFPAVLNNKKNNTLLLFTNCKKLHDPRVCGKISFTVVLGSNSAKLSVMGG